MILKVFYNFDCFLLRLNGTAVQVSMVSCSVAVLSLVYMVIYTRFEMILKVFYKFACFLLRVSAVEVTVVNSCCKQLLSGANIGNTKVPIVE